MMSEIKLPKTQLDLECKNKFGWDLVMNSIQYDVYHIGDFYHSIGGTMGLNSLYCCPSHEELTIDNILPFCGVGAPRWEIRWKGNNYVKTKWGDSSIEHRGIWQIYRNEELFLEHGARDMEYGLSKAQTVLMEDVLEGPIAFHFRNWRDEVLNRKVYYHDQPGIIKSIIEGGQLAVMIAPDGIKEFKSPPQHKEWWNQEGDIQHKTSMLDPAIYWHRD